MFDLKKETIKKNVFLTLSILQGFIFIAGVSCIILGEDSPVKFIVNESPVKLIVPPMLIFFITFALYRNSKKTIEENRDKKQTK